MDYTLIIPAYNEAQAIGRVLDEIGKPEGCREIIVVDDGSTDDTAQIAKSRKANVLSHPINRGYGAALKTGIRAASTEYVVFFDGDGQHRPEDLPKITQPAPSYDLVLGVRSGYQDRTRVPWKKLLGRIVNLLTGRKIADFNSGFRAFRISAVKKILHLMPEGFSFSTTSTVAIIKMGYRLKEVPIESRPRMGRASSVKIFSDGFRALMLILNLIVLFEPLKIFLPASFFFVFASLFYFIVYSIQIRVHVTASMVMLFLTGVLLFFLGVVCEQISAVRREMNHS